MQCTTITLAQIYITKMCAYICLDCKFWHLTSDIWHLTSDIFTGCIEMLQASQYTGWLKKLLTSQYTGCLEKLLASQYTGCHKMLLRVKQISNLSNQVIFLYKHITKFLISNLVTFYKHILSLSNLVIAWDQRNRGIILTNNANRVSNYIGVADTSRWNFKG